MGGIICTVFEGNYHYGVAALANSLYFNGFKGDFYVGYRGNLPAWVTSKWAQTTEFDWEGNAHTLNVKEDFRLIFLEVNQQRHLAHYKPAFMLSLMKDIAPLSTSIAYFDPDIVIKCRWRFYEEWMEFGVALVHEIVSQDMPVNHPTRMQWQRVIMECGKEVTKNISAYINCGFCGVSRENIEFLELWDYYITKAITTYKQDEKIFATFDRTSAFWSIDQDTFNMVAMSCNCPISEMGPEAMDFINAGWTMSHAVGSPKPWKNFFLRSMLSGFSPTLSEKQYWNYANKGIRSHSDFELKRKKYSIIIASFISRFYTRK